LELNGRFKPYPCDANGQNFTQLQINQRINQRFLDRSWNHFRLLARSTDLLGRVCYGEAMRTFSELTRRGRLLEVLRWLCVLPVALLGDFVMQFIVGAVVQIASYGGWGDLGNSNIGYAFGIFLYYVPRKSAFVIAGAKMAPRHQIAAAIGLTVLGFLLSLMTHVVGQYLGGNRVGITNYMHFLAESVGVLGGATYIVLQAWRERRTGMTA
jgi:hypothetical protein